MKSSFTNINKEIIQKTVDFLTTRYTKWEKEITHLSSGLEKELENPETNLIKIEVLINEIEPLLLIGQKEENLIKKYIGKK